MKEYDALSLQVLDLDGNVREDAKVKFKLSRLRIDPQSKTYRIESGWVSGDNRILTVELDGMYVPVVNANTDIKKIRIE